MTAIMERESRGLPTLESVSLTRTSGIISAALDAKKPGKPNPLVGRE